jgi:hypothetical protein
VVESTSAIHLRAARAEYQEISTPASSRGFVEQTLGVVGPNCALETVEQEEPRRSRLSAQPVKLDEVTIGSIPSLEDGWRGRLPPEQLSPQSLQVTAGNPPGGRIDYLTPHRSRPRSNFRHLSLQQTGRANWKSRSLGSKRARILERLSAFSRSEE